METKKLCEKSMVGGNTVLCGVCSVYTLHMLIRTRSAHDMDGEQQSIRGICCVYIYMLIRTCSTHDVDTK